MKVIIEPEDIQTIIDAAKDHYGVILTNEQARNLIKFSSALKEELIIDSHLDTVGREMLSDALVEIIMDGVDGPVHKDKWGRCWSWPCYGSLKKYVEEFDEKFPKAALEKGYKLDESWEKKNENPQS